MNGVSTLTCSRIQLLLSVDPTLHDIKNFVPKQAYRLGKRSVACGDVAGFSVHQNNEVGKEETAIYSAFIHSEKTATKWFKVQVIRGKNDVFESPECTCFAAKNERKCKHISALLLTIFVLLHHRNDFSPPKSFRRPNMKVFDSACAELQHEVGYHLKWPDIIKRIESIPPKKRDYATTYDTFVTVYTPSHKPKPKKNPLNPNDMTVKVLKEKLRERKLSLKGNKAELLLRLKEVMNNENERVEEERVEKERMEEENVEEESVEVERVEEERMEEESVEEESVEEERMEEESMEIERVKERSVKEEEKVEEESIEEESVEEESVEEERVEEERVEEEEESVEEERIEKERVEEERNAEKICISLPSLSKQFSVISQCNSYQNIRTRKRKRIYDEK